ncbi:MAG: 6-pyruvoyl tetrahydrobiopterin synthase [Ignavibacteriales bacterium CG_4_9_14_3_um_filter_30_11]|nr:MAG: 6-pyruvoyl tetrahydrobiopterin synthase [Ignavibacteriales bacterium CG_4_9_14_3_um_filter_30_11]
MVYVTRRETFNAAHRLFNPKFTDEENLKIFGKCSNPNWHGHNYVLEVVVKGEIDKDTGFVIDQKELKRIIKEKVTNKMDHKNLNIETDFMEGVIPTSENIVISIWQQLVNEIKSGSLYSVKLFETENNYFEYRG